MAAGTRREHAGRLRRKVVVGQKARRCNRLRKRVRIYLCRAARVKKIAVQAEKIFAKTLLISKYR
jgi:hypothetical protein